jgi:serine/threonine protein kinase
VAKALQYLHESLPVVIHRDLKLENVMLTSDAIATSQAKLGERSAACRHAAQSVAWLCRRPATLKCHPSFHLAAGDFGLARLTPPSEKEKLERV